MLRPRLPCVTFNATADASETGPEGTLAGQDECHKAETDGRMAD